MIKRLVPLIIIFSLLLSLAACKESGGREADTTRRNASELENIEFKAVVKEKHSGSILVKVIESPVDFSDLAYVLSEKASVKKDGEKIDFDGIKIGDELIIKHHGYIAESYPVQLVGEKEIIVLSASTDTTA